jgi:hypothetical protein
MSIREPELRWPLILVAGTITILLVLITAGALHPSLTKPAARPAAKTGRRAAAGDAGVRAGVLMEVTAVRFELHGARGGRGGW